MHLLLSHGKPCLVLVQQERPCSTARTRVQLPTEQACFCGNQQRHQCGAKQVQCENHVVISMAAPMTALRAHRSLNSGTQCENLQWPHVQSLLVMTTAMYTQAQHTCEGRSDLGAEHTLDWPCARCACVADRTCAMLEAVLCRCDYPTVRAKRYRLLQDETATMVCT